jgi:membrane protease YdiL (CAAX protease family)
MAGNGHSKVRRFMKTDRKTRNANLFYGANAGGKERLYEVSVFLLLILPSMALSFFAVKQGSLSFAVVASSTMLRDLGLISLLFYFLWRNGEPVAQIGWTFNKGLKDIGLGIGLYIPFLLGANLLEGVLRTAGFSAPSTPLPSSIAVKGIPEFLLASALVVVVALAEEIIFRGYLILRLRAVTGSLPVAVISSAVIFSLGHGYEGSAGVITVGMMGLVFGLIYVWRKSLVAPIVMHFLQDFIGIVLMPLLGMKELGGRCPRPPSTLCSDPSPLRCSGEDPSLRVDFSRKPDTSREQISSPSQVDNTAGLFLNSKAKEDTSVLSPYQNLVQ